MTPAITHQISLPSENQQSRPYVYARKVTATTVPKSRLACTVFVNLSACCHRRTWPKMLRGLAGVLL